MGDEYRSQTELDAMEARHLLDHPLFIRAFRNVEVSIVKQIRLVDVRDDVLVTKLMLSLQMLETVEDDLKGYLTDAEYQAKPIGEVDND